MTDAVPSAEEICRNKDLSIRLYKVIEDIGFSTERVTAIRCSSAVEAIYAVKNVENNSAVYILGSRYEGTSTPNMGSDMDMVLCFDDVSVITNLTEKICSSSWLLVPDKYPGYARLQWIGKRQEDMRPPNYYKIELDKHNRACLVFDHDNKDLHGPCSSPNGPAVRMKFPDLNRENDLVIALRGRQWPDCASEWLTRRRMHGWPPSYITDKFKTVGYLLVPVGHPHCEEKEKQFRLSFSFQERVLVTEFNSVQIKCYVLLKLIKKDIIYGSIKEETLTSYHCKTCMFYCIENTPRVFWAPDNLASCLLLCLRQLSAWIHCRFCPNYFIPEENMFDRIQCNELMIKLEICFYCILVFTNLEELLQMLKTDSIGMRLISQRRCTKQSNDAK